MQKLLLIFFFLLYIISTKAQTNKFAELKINLKCKTDTGFINRLNLLYKEIYNENSDSAYSIACYSLNFSKNINYEKGMLKAYYNLADYYELKSDFISTSNYLDSCFNIAKKINSKEDECLIYNLLGISYSDQGEYEKSIRIYNKALSIATQIKFEKGISNSYSNIGVGYFYIGEYGKAAEYYLQALQIYEKNKDTSNAAVILTNLALFYQYKKEYNKSLETNFKALSYLGNDNKHISSTYSNIATDYNYLNNIEKAIEYYNKSLNILKKTNDLKGLAMINNNIANMYSDKKLYKKAIRYSLDALNFSRQTENKSEIAFYLRSYAVHLFEVERRTEALEYALESNKLARETSQLRIVCDNYLLIADIYGDSENYKLCSEYLAKQIHLKDSINQMEYESNIAEMDAKYEGQKKQQQIKLLKKDQVLKDSQISRQATQRNAILVVLILTLFIVIVITKNYIEKKKTNTILTSNNIEISLQKEEITTQRDEIEAQRDLVLEQKDKIEIIHREQTDSIHYAQRIQEAILPKELAKLLPEYFVLFLPKDIVSGDFYWTAKINNLIIITVADCTGHGVPGAFMSMLGISGLKEIIINKQITQPDLILNNLRDYIIDSLQQNNLIEESNNLKVKDGMDMAICTIDLDKLELKFAGAYNPLYVVRNNELTEYKGDKMPIAYYDKMNSFELQTIKITKGDNIYLLSDGFEDQFGGELGKKLKAKALKQLLCENSKFEMNIQKQSITEALLKWKGENEQVDDITLIGIKI